MNRFRNMLAQTVMGCCLLALMMLTSAGSSSAADANLPFRLPRPLASVAPAVKQAVPAEASKVHVVLLVYGPNDWFGDACRADVRGFKEMLEAGFEAKKDRLVFHDYTAKNPTTEGDWTPEEILDDLETIEVGLNENIVVFHSGHGAIGDLSRPEETHILQICGKRTIARKTLQDKLRVKNPRGLTILTDCCSSHRPGIAMNRGPIGRFLVNSASVRNLFLRFAGNVSITAAENGTGALPTYSGPNPGAAGSAFTVALLRLLADGERTFGSWTDLFPVLKQETYAASSNLPGNRPHYAHSFAIDEITVP